MAAEWFLQMTQCCRFWYERKFSTHPYKPCKISRGGFSLGMVHASLLVQRFLLFGVSRCRQQCLCLDTTISQSISGRSFVHSTDSHAHTIKDIRTCRLCLDCEVSEVSTIIMSVAANTPPITPAG